MVQNQFLRLSSRDLILKYKKEKKSIKHDLLNLNPLLPEIFILIPLRIRKLTVSRIICLCIQVYPSSGFRLLEGISLWYP